jgi:hypothetical protein
MMERDASKRPTSMEAIAQSLQSLIERFASKKKRASQPVNPFLWLATLWILFMNILNGILLYIYLPPSLASLSSFFLAFLSLIVLLIILVTSIYFYLDKGKNAVASKLTIKEVGAILNKSIATTRTITAVIWIMAINIFIPYIHDLPSMPRMIIIGLYMAQFGGAIAILVGLQPLLTWLRKMKAARQSQPPTQPEVAQLQQQSRKNSI